MAQLKGSYKEIFVLTAPLLLANASHTFIAITDTMFMSRLDETALATVGYIAMFYMLLVVIGYSFSKGVQILVAKRMGERNEARIGNIVDNSIILLLALAVVLFVVLFFFPEYFLSIFIKDPVLIKTGALFLKYRTPGIFFNYFGVVLISYFSGIGKTIYPGLAMLVMCGSNILLNWLLVFGHWGIPQMGVAGSGLASTLAEVISIFVLLFGIMMVKGFKNHQLLHFKSIDKLEIKELLRMGLPIVGQTFIGFISWIYFFSCIENIMGKHDLAVSNLLKPIYQFFAVPVWSLANSVNTVIGNMTGQGKADEISKITKRFIIVSVGVTMVMIAILLPFPAFWIELISGKTEYTKDCLEALYVVYAAMLMMAVSLIMFNVIVSIGSTLISLTIEIISIILYIVYTYFLFHYTSINLAWAWSTEIIYWLIIAILSYIFLKTYDWKKKIRIQP